MDPEIRAAVDLWIPLAAAAWGEYLAQGRGVLLVDREALLGAHASGGDEPSGDEPGGDEPGGDEPGGDEPGAELAPGYVPLTMIPKGDDFRPLLTNYDPTRQVMLLVRDAGGEERMLTLEGDGVTRPAPEACYQSQR